MVEERLKSGIWVAAEIRRCDGLFLPMTVQHRGDEDRGLILIKQYIAGEGCILYGQRRDMAGKLDWCRPLGDDPVAEPEADAYIARQRQYDADLWVIEVEDPRRRYSPAS